MLAVIFVFIIVIIIIPLEIYGRRLPVSDNILL